MKESDSLEGLVIVEHLGCTIGGHLYCELLVNSDIKRLCAVSELLKSWFLAGRFLAKMSGCGRCLTGLQSCVGAM